MPTEQLQWFHNPAHIRDRSRGHAVIDGQVLCGRAAAEDLVESPGAKPKCGHCVRLLGYSDHKAIGSRFWAQVVKSDECWIWSGHKPRGGYGRFRFDGKLKAAHHVSVFFRSGVWPTYLMHSCDTPACVNPDHLREGNPTLNALDRSVRARHGIAKLNPSSVREVRLMRADGATYQSIGDRFGVSIQTVSNIIHGKIWRHVKDEVTP